MIAGTLKGGFYVADFAFYLLIGELVILELCSVCH